MHIVGTAGHVDHGKSALVAALTGTNPDRWAEERERGMTLDLGFAHLVLEDGIEAGIVDVPGHERFLHNMLAGAAGMEVLLLVVAANEGPREQTIEHLEILKYLNVRRAIVAVTKIDLIPPERRAEVVGEIETALHGTLAEEAPVVAVSSLTGEGLDALRRCLAETLSAVTPRDANAPVYLPVDRVFTLTGRGTIVTGTLMQGSIAVGDRLAFAPSGKQSRVRGIHVFGQARERVEAGSRVALNLAGIDRHDLARGEVAVNEGFEPSASLRVRFHPLAAALPLLRRRTPVRAYLGSAEILGTLVFDAMPVDAGDARATLHLRSPAIVFPGTRFVLRRPSPKTLLGGGAVEGATVAGARDAVPVDQTAILAALHERGLAAVPLEELAQAANLRADAAERALDALAERDEVLPVKRPVAYVDRDAAQALLDAVVRYLEDLHGSEPWAMGATSIALSRALATPEPLLVRVLAEFVDDGRLQSRSGYYAAVGHEPAIAPEQRELFDGLVPLEASAPLLPASFDASLAAVKRSAVAGAAKAFDTLLLRGGFVKVGDALYRGSQISQIVNRVEQYLQRHERMTAAEFRDLLGTSRKYAVPLLEWLDARGVTVRSGDHRTLRKKAP